MAFQRRVFRLLLIVAVALVVVWLRVLQLQVFEGVHWCAQAQAKRERVIGVPAPRGRIVDREGEVLGFDVPIFQLTFVGWEWIHRGRVRCSACGAIRYHEVDGSPRRRSCPCKDPTSRWEPLPLPDISPLEDLLDLPPGDLVRRAEARLAKVRRLVRAHRERVEREGQAAFLVGDEVRRYRRDLLHRPYVVVPRLPPEAVRLVELDEQGRYRGFHVRTDLRRQYPSGGPAAQLLGYVSVVRDAEELEHYRDRYDDNVTLDTRVGRTGLEKGMEDLLLGQVGWRRLSRDTDGAFSVVMGEERPRRGRQIGLGLTREACRQAEAALARSGPPTEYFPRARPSGGFVAMYADSGEIVAWGEMPRMDVEKDLEHLFQEADARAQFDPEVGQWCLPPDVDPPNGETVEAWRLRLAKPAPLHLSRVSQIAVEPGSTFKIFIGLGLLEGLRHMPPGTLLPYSQPFVCGAHHGTPRCHSHRPVLFEDAIEVSCNRFFAFSLRDSPRHWAVYRKSVPVFLGRLGFGQRTGVDVWGESAGIFLRDWVDFDLRQVAHDAVVAVRKAHGVPEGRIILRVLSRMPHRMAGRDPARLRGLLDLLLAEALGVAGTGRVVLTVSGGERRERYTDVHFEVFARPHPGGPAPRPPDIESLERAVRRLGGRFDAEVRDPDGVAFDVTLTYHDAIGRKEGEPRVILADEGRNVAIGQGPVTVTPLQMVRAVATLANGGRLVTPHVAVSADGVPLHLPSRDMGLDPRDVARVRAGMRAVVNGVQGTASRRVPWHTVRAEVYGKTGTAQVGSWWTPYDPSGKGPWHHWFVGFAEAPGMRPLAFACVLHSRMEGAAARTAAPAVCQFLSWWFGHGPDVE